MTPLKGKVAADILTSKCITEVMPLREVSPALLGPDDVAVAFSHSGSTAAVIDAIELTRKNGAGTICVTNDPDSPAAKMVDVAHSATVPPLT